MTEAFSDDLRVEIYNLGRLQFVNFVLADVLVNPENQVLPSDAVVGASELLRNVSHGIATFGPGTKSATKAQRGNQLRQILAEFLMDQHPSGAIDTITKTEMLGMLRHERWGTYPLSDQARLASELFEASLAIVKDRASSEEAAIPTDATWEVFVEKFQISEGLRHPPGSPEEKIRVSLLAAGALAFLLLKGSPAIEREEFDVAMGSL